MPKKKLTKTQVKKYLDQIKNRLYDLFIDKFAYGTASHSPLSVKKTMEMHDYVVTQFNRMKR